MGGSGFSAKAGARISGFWRHLGSPRVLGVHAVRLRVSAALDLAKNPISVAQFFADFASLVGFSAVLGTTVARPGLRVLLGVPGLELGSGWSLRFAGDCW